MHQNTKAPLLLLCCTAHLLCLAVLENQLLYMFSSQATAEKLVWACHVTLGKTLVFVLSSELLPRMLESVTKQWFQLSLSKVSGASKSHFSPVKLGKGASTFPFWELALFVDSLACSVIHFTWTFIAAEIIPVFFCLVLKILIFFYLACINWRKQRK